MISYSDFKKFFCMIVRAYDTDTNNENIVISLENNPYYARQDPDDQPAHIIIDDAELFELYTKVSNMNNDGLELYTGDSYEIALNFSFPMIRNNYYNTNINDNINGFQYDFSAASLEYCVFLLMQLCEVNNNSGIPRIRMLRFKRAIKFGRFSETAEDVTLESLLPRLISEQSLKIRSTSSCALTDFQRRKTAFLFEFMYLSDIALLDYKDVVDLFRINNSRQARIDGFEFNTPPLREYKGDVVDYYKLALSSSDPYIKYISFYHIMEYYYDAVFKKKMVEDLKNRITHPSFSYNNDDKLYELATFIKNRLKMNVEAGQGNELESLNFVLNEYININDLKARIDAIDENAVSYYQTTKVPFCNAPTISWNDTEGVFKTLSKRIYYTRNSLIHSKSSKNAQRYRPYQNEPQLQKEIPLAKALAELIIINSSKVI